MTITGENGAGKSSLLLWLNERLPHSFYLPPSPALDIGAPEEGSTGQRMLRHLAYAAGENTPVLLLDEWDANLDAANREAISAALDRLARTRLVIEVRHGVDESGGATGEPRQL